MYPITQARTVKVEEHKICVDTEGKTTEDVVDEVLGHVKSHIEHKKKCKHNYKPEKENEQKDEPCEEHAPGMDGLAHDYAVQQNSFWAMFYAEFWHVVNFMIDKSEELFTKEMGYNWAVDDRGLKIMVGETVRKADPHHARFRRMAHLVWSMVDVVVDATPCLVQPVGMQHKFYLQLQKIHAAVAITAENICSQDSFLGPCSETCGGESLGKADGVRMHHRVTHYRRTMKPLRGRGGGACARRRKHEVLAHAGRRHHALQHAVEVARVAQVAQPAHRRRRQLAAPPVRGLRNLGNSCYLNCVLQSVVATPGVREHFVFAPPRARAPAPAAQWFHGAPVVGDAVVHAHAVGLPERLASARLRARPEEAVLGADVLCGYRYRRVDLLQLQVELVLHANGLHEAGRGVDHHVHHAPYEVRHAPEPGVVRVCLADRLADHDLEPAVVHGPVIPHLLGEQLLRLVDHEVHDVPELRVEHGPEAVLLHGVVVRQPVHPRGVLFARLVLLLVLFLGLVIVLALLLVLNVGLDVAQHLVHYVLGRLSLRVDADLVLFYLYCPGLCYWVHSFVARARFRFWAGAKVGRSPNTDPGEQVLAVLPEHGFRKSLGWSRSPSIIHNYYI